MDTNRSPWSSTDHRLIDSMNQSSDNINLLINGISRLIIGIIVMRSSEAKRTRTEGTPLALAAAVAEKDNIEKNT